jgi:phenylacetate-CoA ligase
MRGGNFRIMNFQPEIERKSKNEIQKFQEKELVKLLEYLAARSPFYQRHFQNHSISVGIIQTLDDLRKIPPTTKDDMQSSNFDFLCVPRSQVVEYTSTSGTLGRPVTIAMTEGDLQRLAYNEAISFACADGSSDDVFQLMLTLDRQFMAGIAYYLGTRMLGASIVRVGPGVPAMQLDTILRLKPTVLVAVPSFLLKLIEYAEAHGVDLNSTSVQKAICIGESLRAGDLQLSVIGKKISEKWQIKLYSTYASTEMQTAFTECSHGAGGHMHPELIILELLGEDDQPVAPGTAGEITITTLGVQGMPLLRYKTGDIAIAHDGPCPCGRTTVRLGPVLGRKQYLIKLRGTSIYPSGIFEILNDVDTIQDYVVEACTGELETDELRIHILSNGEGRELMERKLNSVFQSRLRVLPEINFVTARQLEQLQLGKGERKIRRFIDSRKS